MNYILIILIIILVCEGISRTEVSVKCCITGCKNKAKWDFLTWLSACIFTASTHPYVCEEHAEIFLDMADDGKIKLTEGRRSERYR